MEEIWKDIPGYERLYQISNLGRVKSLERTITKSNGVTQQLKEKILKGYNNGEDYYKVSLNGKEYYIHKLVAMAFLPNPDNLSCVDHISTNKNDNSVTNLKWVSHKGNANNPLTIENMKKVSNRPRQIIGKSTTTNKTIVFGSIRQADEYFNNKYAHQNISRCLRGLRTSSYGYTWSVS